MTKGMKNDHFFWNISLSNRPTKNNAFVENCNISIRHIVSHKFGQDLYFCLKDCQWKSSLQMSSPANWLAEIFSTIRKDEIFSAIHWGNTSHRFCEWRILRRPLKFIKHHHCKQFYLSFGALILTSFKQVRLTWWHTVPDRLISVKSAEPSSSLLLSRHW